MPQIRKPAALKKGHDMSKAEKEEAAKRESFIGGSNSDELKRTPEYLSPLAKKYYNYLINELEPTGILNNIDTFAVRETAICLDRMQKTDEVINELGTVFNKYDKNNTPIPCERPEVGIKNKLIQQFKMLSSQLGLTPSSRSQLASLDIERAMSEKDPLERILNDTTQV